MGLFDDGVWRTIGGRKVFIKKGQSMSDAMKESGKFKTTKEQKKAGVEVKESDFDKDFKDMSDDELKNHLNKLENGMDDFDQDEPEFKQLQKEYNEAKKQLDSRSKKSEDKYDKAVKEGTFTKEEAEYMKAGEKFRKGESTNEDYEKAEKEFKGEKSYTQSDVDQAKSDYEHAADKYEHYKFNGADDEDRIKYKKAKDEAYDNYVKKQRDYDENRLKPKSESYTQKDLDNAKAKMLEMEGTLDDASSDPEIRKSAAYKDIKNEYNQAKAEYDKISNSLRETKANNDAKQKTLGDRIMGKSEAIKRIEELKKEGKVDSTGTKAVDRETQKEVNRLYLASHEPIDKETHGNSSMFKFNKPEQQNLKTYSNELKYKEYYKKENLGEPSNYQKGDKIEFSDGYYSTLKGSIVREATDKEKKYQMNSNLKGYVVRDSHGNEHVVPDTRIKNIGGTQAYKSAYEDYKKKHPNTKLSFGQFVDMSEGK